jgi:ribosome-associated heat shock protein Hsp15
MSNEGTVRLDVWLDVACLFKTRSQAQQACQRGRIEVNGHRGKPHRLVRAGDEIRISVPGGSRRILEIMDVESTHVPRSRARELYVDHTPPPSPEELELRRLQRLSSPPRRTPGMGAPKKGERRRLRQIKEGWEE